MPNAQNGSVGRDKAVTSLTRSASFSHTTAGNNAARLARRPSHRYTDHLGQVRSPSSDPGMRVQATSTEMRPRDGAKLARKSSQRRHGDRGGAVEPGTADRSQRQASHGNKSTGDKSRTSRGTTQGGRTTMTTTTSTTTSSSSHAAAQTDAGSKVTRKASSWQTRASEAEREDRRRRRNRECARRARERERSEREIMEKAYDANEVRIRQLEMMVHELSGELRKHSTISNGDDGGPDGDERKRDDSRSFDSSEDRPNWFGKPF